MLLEYVLKTMKRKLSQTVANAMMLSGKTKKKQIKIDISIKIRKKQKILVKVHFYLPLFY